MKNLNKYSIAFLSLILTLGFVNSSVLAATTPSLATLSSYGLLSSTFTRNVGVTSIVGDVGYTTLSGGGTNTVTGTTNQPALAQSGTDQGTILTSLNNQACTFTFASGSINLSTDTTHGPAGFYTPGVYCTGPASAASIGTAGITLSGTGTYIFRINGAFTSVNNSNITLSNGASSCDTFWTPTAATTLGANTTFSGIIIDDAGITIGNTTALVGKVLSFGGTITTDTDSITSTCLNSQITPAMGGGPLVTYIPMAAAPLVSSTSIPTPTIVVNSVVSTPAVSVPVVISNPKVMPVISIVPSFPKTGFAPQENNSMFNRIINFFNNVWEQDFR